MTTTEKGERTEATVLAYMIKKGWTVCIPFGNAKRYDFVVDCGDGKLLRVQCKTARMVDGKVTFNTCSTYNYTGERKDYRGAADIFVVYCPHSDRFYRVPVEMAGKTMMQLRITVPAVRGQQKTIKWAKDFEF